MPDDRGLAPSSRAGAVRGWPDRGRPRTPRLAATQRAARREQRMPRGRRRRFAAHRHALGSAAHTPDAHRYGPLVERAPIGTLVNTHSDGDHWWANQEVAAAEIIATEAASAVMEDESPAEMKRFGALASALPPPRPLPVADP